MNWKSQLGIGLLVVVVAVTGIWLWRDSVWRERIASTPAVRDTTVSVVLDTVYVPKIQVKVIHVSRVDSTHAAPRWWIAKADTVVDGARLQFEYNSPLPLSPRGFFCEIQVQLPPRIDSVRTVTVVETRTVIEERVSWEWIVGALGAGVVVGALL